MFQSAPTASRGIDRSRRRRFARLLSMRFEGSLAISFRRAPRKAPSKEPRRVSTSRLRELRWRNAKDSIRQCLRGSPDLLVSRARGEIHVPYSSRAAPQGMREKSCGRSRGILSRRTGSRFRQFRFQDDAAPVASGREMRWAFDLTLTLFRKSILVGIVPRPDGGRRLVRLTCAAKIALETEAGRLSPRRQRFLS